MDEIILKTVVRGGNYTHLFCFKAHFSKHLTTRLTLSTYLHALQSRHKLLFEYEMEQPGSQVVEISALPLSAVKPRACHKVANSTKLH